MSRNNGSAVTLSARFVTVCKEPKSQHRGARKLSHTAKNGERAKEIHPLLGEIWRDGHVEQHDNLPPSRPAKT